LPSWVWPTLEYVCQRLTRLVLFSGVYNVAGIEGGFAKLGEASTMQLLNDQAPPDARLATADLVAAVGAWYLFDAPAHVNGILVPVHSGQAAA
jgi:hypothetical protein